MGVIRNVNGYRVGEIEADGTVRDVSGYRVGSVEPNGTVRDVNGYRVGEVEPPHIYGGGAALLLLIR
jgi:hypothetical protein